jgi:hypothetical protein
MHARRPPTRTACWVAASSAGRQKCPTRMRMRRPAPTAQAICDLVIPAPTRSRVRRVSRPSSKPIVIPASSERAGGSSMWQVRSVQSLFPARIRRTPGRGPDCGTRGAGFLNRARCTGRDGTGRDGAGRAERAWRAGLGAGGAGRSGRSGRSRANCARYPNVMGMRTESSCSGRPEAFALTSTRNPSTLSPGGLSNSRVTLNGTISSVIQSPAT